MVLLTCLLCWTLSVSAFQCKDLGRDLLCSACGHFVETFFNELEKAKPVIQAGKVPSAHTVYRERLQEIFLKHDPAKVKTADHLLQKSGIGREHDLYLKVCNKYGVPPEDEFDPENDLEEDFVEKDIATEDALQRAINSVNGGKVKWAVL